jgi:hypothetical protein
MTTPTTMMATAPHSYAVTVSWPSVTPSKSPIAGVTKL